MSTADDYGDLDGDPVDIALVKITGQARLRRLHPGERITLTITATIQPDIRLRHADGLLTRTATAKADAIWEPTGEIAAEIEAALADASGQLDLRTEPEPEHREDPTP